MYVLHKISFLSLSTVCTAVLRPTYFTLFQGNALLLRTMDTAHLVDFSTGTEIWHREWKWQDEDGLHGERTMLTRSLCSWSQVEEVEPTQDGERTCRIRLRLLDSKTGREVHDGECWRFIPDEKETVYDIYDILSSRPEAVANGNLICLASVVGKRYPSVFYQAQYFSGSGYAEFFSSREGIR